MNFIQHNNGSLAWDGHFAFDEMRNVIWDGNFAFYSNGSVAWDGAFAFSINGVIIWDGAFAYNEDREVIGDDGIELFLTDNIALVLKHDLYELYVGDVCVSSNY